MATLEPDEIMTPKQQIYARAYGHPGPLTPAAIALWNKKVHEAEKKKGRE